MAMSDATINIGLISVEDLKLIEALEHLKSVAAEESHAPSFEDGLRSHLSQTPQPGSGTRSGGKMSSA
jgi:hypothetical protein